MKHQLKELIHLGKKWIKVYQQHPNNSKYLEQFKTVSKIIEISAMGLNQLEATKKIRDFTEQATQVVHTESLNNLTEKIQETIPDFFPVTQQIIEGCTITTMNYGTLSLNTKSILSGGIQFFALNSNPIEQLNVPRNCTGEIVLVSNWIYRQALKNDGINLHSFAGIETAHKVYSITHSFQVDEAGNIQLFKGSIVKQTDIVNNPSDTLFYIKDLEVSLDSNCVLSLTGGLYENKASIIPDTLKYYLATQLKGKKELFTSFSVALELEKESPKTVAPHLKELIFEKENQAILSSDQTKYLQEWWDKLNPKLKEAIENQKATIWVEGYTSDTGGHDYNLDLGEKRALFVKEQLHKIIGKVNGQGIARIVTKSSGEHKQSKRYVKITIANN